MAKLIKVRCANCGWPFVTYVNRPATCCSKACYNAVRNKKTKVKILCRGCGIEFETSRANQVFCSKSCKNTHEQKLIRKNKTWLLKKCQFEFCGKTFKGDGREKFCCKEHAKRHKLIADKDRLILKQSRTPDEAVKACVNNPWRIKFAKEKD